MDVTLMLCDAAQAIGGKLYILGGGWSWILVPDAPFNMALAIKLEVPWHEANDPHRVVARLITAEGEPVRVQPEGADEPIPLVNAVTIETGRPPGLAPGTSIDAPLVFGVNGLRLPADSYVWELEVDGNPEARAAFRVGPVQRR